MFQDKTPEPRPFWHFVTYFTIFYTINIYINHAVTTPHGWDLVLFA